MAGRLHHTRMRASREVVVPRVLLPLQLMSVGRRIYSLYRCAHGRGTRLGWLVGDGQLVRSHQAHAAVEDDDVAAAACGCLVVRGDETLNGLA